MDLILGKTRKGFGRKGGPEFACYVRVEVNSLKRSSWKKGGNFKI